MSPLPPDPEPLTLTLDAKGVLDFIEAQNRRDREYFDKLLKWFGGGLAIVVTVLAFFGYHSVTDVQAIREETRKRMNDAVKDELASDNVRRQVSAALQEKTDQLYKEAINAAVARELSTPERQNIIKAATQRQIDASTKDLRESTRISELSTVAMLPDDRSRAALIELRSLSKSAAEASIRALADAEVHKILDHWEHDHTEPGFVSTINGKAVSPLSAEKAESCDIIAELHSSKTWKTRLFLILLLHNRDGVLGELFHELSDTNLSVAAFAKKSFQNALDRSFSLRKEKGPGGFLNNELSEMGSIPDPVELQRWWDRNRQVIEVGYQGKALNCK